MKRFSTAILFFSFVFLFVCCSEEKPIKDEDKFAKIYVDLLINAENNKNDSLKAKAEKERILQRYMIEQKQYDATIKYYNQDPERWKVFFERVDLYLNSINKGTKHH